jgi:hypothetical protein
MPVIVVAVVAIVLYYIIKSVSPAGFNSFFSLFGSQITQKGAKVASKRIFVKLSQVKYFTAFEFADGSRLEFEVSEITYSLLGEEDTGVLEYQNNRYVNFHRSSQSIEQTAQEIIKEELKNDEQTGD